MRRWCKRDHALTVLIHQKDVTLQSKKLSTIRIIWQKYFLKIIATPIIRAVI